MKEQPPRKSQDPCQWWHAHTHQSRSGIGLNSAWGTPGRGWGSNSKRWLWRDGTNGKTARGVVSTLSLAHPPPGTGTSSLSSQGRPLLVLLRPSLPISPCSPGGNGYQALYLSQLGSPDTDREQPKVIGFLLHLALAKNYSHCSWT